MVVALSLRHIVGVRDARGERWLKDMSERRYELEERRRRLEDEAQAARVAGDLAKAERAWRKALDLARQATDEFGTWLIEGQLGELLVELQRFPEATRLLEASLASGNDIPLAESLLVDIYMRERAFDQAFRIRRESWRCAEQRAHHQGRPPQNPFWRIVNSAKAWDEYDSVEPIALAEQWATQLQHREAWFAARHERGQSSRRQGRPRPRLPCTSSWFAKARDTKRRTRAR